MSNRIQHMLNNETRYKCTSNIKENRRTGENETYRIIETEPIRNQPRRAESASPLQLSPLRGRARTRPTCDSAEAGEKRVRM